MPVFRKKPLKCAHRVKDLPLQKMHFETPHRPKSDVNISFFFHIRNSQAVALTALFRLGRSATQFFFRESRFSPTTYRGSLLSPFSPRKSVLSGTARNAGVSDHLGLHECGGLSGVHSDDA